MSKKFQLNLFRIHVKLDSPSPNILAPLRRLTEQHETDFHLVNLVRSSRNLERDHLVSLSVMAPSKSLVRLPPGWEARVWLRLKTESLRLKSWPLSTLIRNLFDHFLHRKWPSSCKPRKKPLVQIRTNHFFFRWECLNWKFEPGLHFRIRSKCYEMGYYDGYAKAMECE